MMKFAKDWAAKLNRLVTTIAFLVKYAWENR